MHSGMSDKVAYHGYTQRRKFSGFRNTSFKENKKPNVLIVNHGYPPEFNGGSEVYSQTLAVHLHQSGECESVAVMAREQDPYRSDFQIRRTVDSVDSSLPVYLVNYPREAAYYQFQSHGIDDAFREVVQQQCPDVVHFQHLNHLSLNLPKIAKDETGAKIIYTLHDYWLMCPRGQFLINGTTSLEPWQQCTGQDDQKCASSCYTSRYATGGSIWHGSDQSELSYWTTWVGKRMESVRSACNFIDAFVAPSRYLQDKFVQQFYLPEEKLLLLPYGFDHERLTGRQRIKSTGDSDAAFVFGYIGRHQPAKGINILVAAALKLLADDATLLGQFEVRIYGRADMNSSLSLRRQIEAALPDASVQQRVFHWCREYNNIDIVKEVFNHVDAIVVPSIWEENSPLVIHEAQQCGVPVITSDRGGMGELVRHNVNGLTFAHRSSDSLAQVMLHALERGASDMSVLGARGYLGSESGNIPSMIEHGESILQFYSKLLNNLYSSYETRDEMTNNGVGFATGVEFKIEDTGGVPAPIELLPYPWRITFDTNPDDCNFSCTMCEQHSEHSPHQKHRKAHGIRRGRMDFELIQRTLHALAPLGTRESIPTTMGEPLMYKEFEQYLHLCKDLNIKVNLTTNGSFTGRGVTQWAELIVPVSVDVKISWNGMTSKTQEKIMKNSNLGKQIANLQTFISIRDRVAAEGGNYCSTTLQLTFMEGNLQEIPDIVAFAIESGCDRVKGHHLWAHFDEIKGEDLRRSTSSIVRWNAVAAQCRDFAAKNPLKNGKFLRLDNFFDLDMSAARSDDDSPGEVTNSPIHPEAVCPFLGKEIWINHEGRVDVCCAPDEQRKSLGYFGNINEPGQSLAAIWNGDKYKELCRSYHTKPLCRGCNMRKPPARN